MAAKWKRSTMSAGVHRTGVIGDGCGGEVGPYFSKDGVTWLRTKSGVPKFRWRASCEVNHKAKCRRSGIASGITKAKAAVEKALVSCRTKSKKR